MNFYEKITGSDITKEMNFYEVRVKDLPTEFQTGWKEITNRLWVYGDFSGRNLLPVFESVLELLEVTSADGQRIAEVIEDDIDGFCSALVGGEKTKAHSDKWREQLNKNVARKLGGMK